MFWQLHRRKAMGWVSASFLLAGCAGSPQATAAPSPQGLGPAQPPPDSQSAGTRTATPDPCTGWTCTLQGVVHSAATGPGKGLAGIRVNLSHLSYCSPTRGRREATTCPGGGFGFDLFLHDTDTFSIRVEWDGYEPLRQLISGFDCLYCDCPALEIVLQPLGTPAAAP